MIVPFERRNLREQPVTFSSQYYNFTDADNAGMCAAARSRCRLLFLSLTLKLVASAFFTSPPRSTKRLTNSRAYSTGILAVAVALHHFCTTGTANVPPMLQNSSASRLQRSRRHQRAVPIRSNRKKEFR